MEAADVECVGWSVDGSSLCRVLRMGVSMEAAYVECLGGSMEAAYIECLG